MRNSFKIGLLLFISVLNINCSNNKKANAQATSEKIVVISPAEFKENSKDQLLVDIRTPREFNEGHLEGAINIDFFDKKFLLDISKLDKSKPLYIYCRSGNRSSKASPKIIDLGFKQVYDLQGGIKNWVKNNYQIVK